MRTRLKWIGTLACLALYGAPASAVNMEWVTVGAPYNASDTAVNCFHLEACGSVSYVYRIGKYEVTNDQYAEFLNAVAALDPNALYSAYMTSSPYGGITRSGSSGSYSYAAKPGMGSKPVTFVAFWDGARFANWLHNGQPVGAQTAATTEDGAYTLTPAAIAANTMVRNAGAQVFLPSESEWYKAAYYDPIEARYYAYPAGTDLQTICSGPTVAANHANCSPGGADTVTEVGAYTASESPNRTFDQGGNVWEWNEQPVNSSSRGLRGGSFYYDASRLWAAYRNFNIATGEFIDSGFRVASIPEPSTGLLALTGLTGLALGRRVRG